jgi:PEP-CTERM motif
LKLRLSVFGVALAACFVMEASAGTIDLGINGEMQVSTSAVSFGQYPLGGPYSPAPGYGSFEVSLTNPGIFQSNGVTNGEFGTIESLNGSTPVGVMLNPTPGSSLPFMTFDAGGLNLQLYLTELMPGSTIGPFTVTNTPDGAVAAFAVDGFVYNTLTATRTSFTGTLSATFDGMSAADFINADYVDTPFTATFIATLVPEPSTFLLFGLGAACIGLIARRTRRTT